MSIPCTKCGQVYADAFCLEQHMKNMHDSGETPRPKEWWVAQNKHSNGPCVVFTDHDTRFVHTVDCPNMVFASRYRFIRKLDLEKAPKKPFRCRTCGTELEDIVRLSNPPRSGVEQYTSAQVVSSKTVLKLWVEAINTWVNSVEKRLK